MVFPTLTYLLFPTLTYLLFPTLSYLLFRTLTYLMDYAIAQTVTLYRVFRDFIHLCSLFFFFLFFSFFFFYERKGVARSLVTH